MSKTFTRTAVFKVMGWICLLLVLGGYSFQSTAQNLPQAQPGGSAPVLMAQLGHSIPILSVAFSPDGKYVATGSNDYTACLWQTDTGRQIRRYEGHSGVVDSVAFTPDGKQVLTGSEGGTASRWQKDTGRLIRKLDVHSDDIWSLAFSPDGKYVLTGSKNGAAREWQLETGKLIRKFDGEYGTVLSVAFSPDDNYVLTGTKDGSARLWQTDTGKQIRKFEGHTGSVQSVAFSPNGKYVLTGSDDKTATLWQADTGNRIRKFEGHAGSVDSVAFSPDSGYVLTGSQDKTACLWRTATGEQVRKFEGHSDVVTSVAFSHDGKYVLTGSEDGTARQWQLETGRLIRKFVGHSDAVSSVAVSQDGRYVLTGGADKTACLWETHTGKRIRSFSGHSTWVLSVAFSPDGKYVATGSQDKTACLWETETGKLICTFDGHSDPVSTVAFSPDGKYVLTGSEDKTARLWQIATGKLIRKFVGHSDLVSSVAFSPDGKYVLTGSYDKTARLWQMETGELIRKYEGHSEAIWSAVFSPNGKYVLTGSDDKTARLWEAETGIQIRIFDGHSEPVSSVAFSADGKYVLTGSGDKTGRLWQTDTGKQIRMFDANSSIVTSVAFTPDSHYVLIASAEGTTRLWDTATGRELCRLISFDDGTWAVTDNQGRYDASNEGDVSGLHWVVDTGKGPYAVPLDRLKARYYDPGLLAKYMGLNAVPVRPVEKFAGTAPPPEITASAPAGNSTKLSISLVNEGGGIGAVQVRVNGKEVTADARGTHPNPEFSPQKLTVDLAAAPLQPGKINDITIISRNRDGSWASDPYHLVWSAPSNIARGPVLANRPAAFTSAAPELYAVVAGIDTYSGGEVRPLTFPDQDARQIAKALRLGADRLLGAGHFHLSMLSDQSAKEAELPAGALLLTPTRKHFGMVFADLAKKVHATDILVIYLSGHGTAFVDPASKDAIKDTYCYLTEEANSFDVRDDKVRATCAITSKELATWTDAHHIQALKQVLILDTCYAGSAKGDLVVRKADAAEQEIATRALSDTKDRTSFYVLMGCARDAVSYETSQFGQGLLTYALLRGLQGDQLKNGELVDVAPWFEYAAHLVPELAREIGSAQAPQIMQRTDVSGSDASDRLQASSFSIGRLTAADKEQIQLPRPHPLVMRPSFLDETGEDDLKLSAEVRRLLLANSLAAGKSAGSGLVYVDVNPEDAPGGIAVTGNYREEGQTWTVHLVVRKGAQRVLETVTAVKDELAAKVMTAIEIAAAGFK